MASKRRKMFYQNEKQEMTEICTKQKYMSSQNHRVSTAISHSQVKDDEMKITLGELEEMYKTEEPAADFEGNNNASYVCDICLSNSADSSDKNCDPDNEFRARDDGPRSEICYTNSTQSKTYIWDEDWFSRQMEKAMGGVLLEIVRYKRRFRIRGLDQLEDIYHEARENLKPFLTAPESVESFHEEEMFPCSTPNTTPSSNISDELSRLSIQNLLLLLLATALVKLYTSKTNFIVVRAVLDSASQASFVSEAVVNSLKIKRDHSAIPISGIGLSDSQSSGLSHISVASLSGAVVSTNHPFLVLPVITRVASSLPPSSEFTAALKNVVLADPSFNSAAPIDCLLGASIFPTILTGAPRSLGPSLPYAVPTLFGDVLMGPAPLTPLSCNVACVSLLASAGHNPVLRNAPAYPVESHDPGPATLLFLSGDRDSVDHSPDSQDPPIKMLHRSLEVEKTPPTKVLQLPLGSASEEFSLKPNEQTSKPPDELLETAPESPGIPLITTPESYSLNSISSWPRRFLVEATILARRSRNLSKPHSTRSCVWHAEIAVCQHIQQSRFAPQLNQTQAGKPLSKSWVRLSPLISDDGLIRAGGRCLHSPSCPILLPNDHPLVLALTDYLYVFFSQAGPLLFYFNLSGLWIFSARRIPTNADVDGNDRASDDNVLTQLKTFMLDVAGSSNVDAGETAGRVVLGGTKITYVAKNITSDVAVPRIFSAREMLNCIRNVRWVERERRKRYIRRISRALPLHGANRVIEVDTMKCSAEETEEKTSDSAQTKNYTWDEDWFSRQMEKAMGGISNKAIGDDDDWRNRSAIWVKEVIHDFPEDGG
ncbi:hypothetical protein AAG570_008081 [Ranatra chinensis]|uniref:Peptidase aspartic putative domain-containing protein n=1 Tax=Ranatra chinensis TaxID=642074 RepID=A0ABD0Y6Z1_9HEMI